MPPNTHTHTHTHTHIMYRQMIKEYLCTFLKQLKIFLLTLAFHIQENIKHYTNHVFFWHVKDESCRPFKICNRKVYHLQIFINQLKELNTYKNTTKKLVVTCITIKNMCPQCCEMIIFLGSSLHEFNAHRMHNGMICGRILQNSNKVLTMGVQ